MIIKEKHWVVHKHIKRDPMSEEISEMHIKTIRYQQTGKSEKIKIWQIRCIGEAVKKQELLELADRTAKVQT